jgi:Tol biopolymer transport system component
MKRIIVILFYCLIFSLTISGQDNNAEKLLRDAIYQEEVNGDLNDVIKMYESIVTKFPDNRAAAAKAQLHIGICYEKLGLKEASKAYDKVVKNYPDQKSMVIVAKERLNRLVASSEKELKSPLIPKFTKIRTPFSIPQWSGSQLSPDGKVLAFGSGGDIWTVPIPGKVDSNLAGEPKKIEGGSDVLGQGLSWSGDGEWLAFSRAYINDLRGGGTRIKFNPEGAHIDVIPSSGGDPKRIQIPLWIDNNGETRLQVSLSPDGKMVAFDSDGQIFIALVETGTIRQVTTEGGACPRFSPDGSKIAYKVPKGFQENPPSSLGEVWIISPDGNDAVKVSGDVNKNIESWSGPTWSPDGKMIAFCRIDVGEKINSKICIIPLSDQLKPLSNPLQIELPIPSMGSITGWSPDNKIGLLLETPFTEYVYTVPVEGGKVSQISPLNNGASTPRWSPDGKRVYFRLNRGSIGSVPGNGGDMKIHPGLEKFRNETGFFLIYPGSGNSVSPDGKSIVFCGGTGNSGPNIYTTPLEGGEPFFVTSGEGYPCWSPDGKWIAYLDKVENDDGKTEEAIFKVSREGGSRQKITSLDNNVTAASIEWSPDGKMIAYFAKNKNETAGTIRIVSVDSKESKELCPVQRIAVHSDLSWSPDGQKIAFVSRGKIWIVSSSGGEPIEVKIDVDARVGMLDWSPDGKKIVFSGGSGMKKELWFMEDFLPKVVTSN